MSDLLTNLVRRARGAEPAVRPVSLLYGAGTGEPFDVVEVEVETQPRAPARRLERRTPERREPAEGARPAPSVLPASAPAAARTQPEGSSEPVEPRASPAVPSPSTESVPSPAPGPHTTPGEERPVVSPAQRRSPHVEPRPAQAPWRPPLVVERRVEHVAGEESRQAQPAPQPAVRPRPRGATVRRPPTAHKSVLPDLPAPEVREPLVLAAEPVLEPATIHVSIGRVEIRASVSERPAGPVELARPRQSLDDYLLGRERRRA